MSRPVALLVALVLGATATQACAADSDEELQKKINNPVADLVSLPIQYNATFNTGPLEKVQHTLNVQPVYPASFGPDWKLIHRLIVPVLSNPAFTPDESRKNGIGDITYEGFFSPAATHGHVMWGAGAIAMLRTASDERLGSGKWSAGPAVVVLTQPGRWTIGALVTQAWSFAGSDGRPDVNQLQFQPILNYRLSPQHSIGYIGTLTANWKQPSSERWTIPVGASYSILTRPSWIQTPVNVVMGAGKNIERTASTGDWYVRLQLNFVFPK